MRQLVDESWWGLKARNDLGRIGLRAGWVALSSIRCFAFYWTHW